MLVSVFELFSIKSIRKRITYVSQQPLIFSASVKENVSYVRPDATHDEIINSCKAANAHSFIEDLPNKYNETLHEGGTNLSGGERQRIMLARAFLAATDIIILDEATSSVDFESEDDINDDTNDDADDGIKVLGCCSWVPGSCCLPGCIPKKMRLNIIFRGDGLKNQRRQTDYFDPRKHP